jgi:ATP synthase protein I
VTDDRTAALMTTAKPTPRTGRPVLGPLSVTGGVGLVTVILGVLVGGAPGAAGAAVGAVLVCAVLASGAVVVGAVAAVSPKASLLVALLTYTLQVLLVGLVYVGLREGGALSGPVDARWLSAAVIACTLVWTGALVVVSTRSRQPVYDLDHEHGTCAR